MAEVSAGRDGTGIGAVSTAEVTAGAVLGSFPLRLTITKISQIRSASPRRIRSN